MKLAVTSILPHLLPTVCLDKNDELFDLHDESMAQTSRERIIDDVMLQRVGYLGTVNDDLAVNLQMLDQSIQLSVRKRAFGILDRCTNGVLERFNFSWPRCASLFQIVDHD